MEETMEKSEEARLDSMEVRLTEVVGHLKKVDRRVADLFRSQHKLEESCGRIEWTMDELSKQLHELAKVLIAGSDKWETNDFGDGSEEWMTNEIGNISRTEMQFSSSASFSSNPSEEAPLMEKSDPDSQPIVQPIMKVRMAELSTGGFNSCKDMVVCEEEIGYGKAEKELTGSKVHSLTCTQKVFEKMPEPIEGGFPMATGQRFPKTTQALFHNYKQLPVMKMLDSNLFCGGETPHIAGIISFGSLWFVFEPVESLPYKERDVACTAVKPCLVVDAPKANDAVLFYKEAFGAEEVSRVNYSKRKTEQELPLVLSAELKLGSSTIVVSNLTDDISAPVKYAPTGSMFCLGIENVAAQARYSMEWLVYDKQVNKI